MAFEIVLSELAHQDRIDILKYWYVRNKSNSYSKKLDAIFRTSFELISNFPNIGRKLGIKKFRYWMAKDYLIVYFVDKNTITIVTIWDERRNPNNLKEKLLK